LPRWLHALPLLLLVLAAAGIVARDANSEPKPPPQVTERPKEVAKDEPVFIPPVDPDPRIEARFNGKMSFGVLMLQAGDPKKLTYSEDGFTNNTVLRIDGLERLFGDHPEGRWVEKPDPPGKVPDGNNRRQRCVYRFADQKIKVTQIVEIIPSYQAVEVPLFPGLDVPRQPRRLLNTCLIRYLLENEETDAGKPPRKVGLRFLLDTFIGANDGVPFTIPGKEGLVTLADLDEPEKVPDFIQALERSNLLNPGTIAHLTLRLGKALEPPNRVRLTHWLSTTSWGVPMRPITAGNPDSACVLYWDERDLKPGEKREIGFAYGLGSVSSDEGQGVLAVTAKGVLDPEEEFSVIAYVNNPGPGEKLTLELPEGFRLVEGTAEREVLQPAADAKDRRRVVTWKVKAAEQEKNYKLKVSCKLAGVTQTKSVLVWKPRPTDQESPGRGIFR
jgi:hypothetical protein